MNKITDLHGNTYKLGDYRLKYQFPKFTNCKRWVYTKDIISSRTFNIITTEDKTYGVTYSSIYGLYIVYKLGFISYEESKDIRKSYLHGNRYHS